jgi:hypothetical protein
VTVFSDRGCDEGHNHLCNQGPPSRPVWGRRLLRPRVRDVLPLPSFVPFSFDRHRLSRSSIRNLTRKNKILDWANAGVKCLGHLGEKGPAEPAPGTKLSAGTLFAQSHILQCYQDVGSPPCTLSLEGALHELLSKSHIIVM